MSTGLTMTNADALVITNNAERRRAWFRMIEETGKNLEQLMVQWGGVLNFDLIAFTPPRAGKEKDAVSGEVIDLNRTKSGRVNWKKQRDTGEKAVARDVGYLFPDLMLAHVIAHPVEGLDRWAKYMQKYINERNMEALAKMLRDIRLPVPIVLEKASASVHSGARNERGRVRRGDRYPVLNHQSVLQLTKALQRDVGKAKAGWVTRKMLVKNIPSWVTRHRMPDGSVVDLTGPNYRIEFHNTSPASKGMNAELMVRPAIEILERKFMKSLEKVIAHNHRKQ